MDKPNDGPVAPWEAEQAAEALAEIRQGKQLDLAEREALKAADGSLLISEVDRMIAEKRSDLSRMRRLSSPLSQDVDARGVVLASLAKPACIVVLLLAIIAMGLALHWMAGSISGRIDALKAQQSQPQDGTTAANP